MSLLQRFPTGFSVSACGGIAPAHLCQRAEASLAEKGKLLSSPLPLLERKPGNSEDDQRPRTPTIRCVSTHQTFNRRQRKISKGCSDVVLAFCNSGMSR